MSSPVVSIVFPVKNGERFLSQSLQSVFNQDYANFELIVIDGHSNDGSTGIIKSFSRANYVLQEKGGIAEAWNQGIRDSRGEYIAFMASDDLWAPSKLSRQVAYFREHPGIRCSITEARIFLEPGTSPPAGFKEELLDADRAGYMLEALMAERSVFDEIGGFDTRLDAAQDVDWFARQKDSNIALAIIPEVLLRKRVHDLNLTFNITPSSSNQGLLAAMRKSIERQRNKPREASETGDADASD